MPNRLLTAAKEALCSSSSARRCRICTGRPSSQDKTERERAESAAAAGEERSTIAAARLKSGHRSAASRPVVPAATLAGITADAGRSVAPMPPVESPRWAADCCSVQNDWMRQKALTLQSDATAATGVAVGQCWRRRTDLKLLDPGVQASAGRIRCKEIFQEIF